MDKRIENIIQTLYGDDENFRDCVMEFYSKLESIKELGDQNVLIDLNKLIEKYAKSR